MEVTLFSLLSVETLKGLMHRRTNTPRRTKCGRVKCACLPWLYGLFVRTLISRTNAYASCGKPTLNFIEHFYLGHSVRTETSLRHNVKRHHYLLSGCHEDQRLCRTIDIRFISKLWCAWGSKCNLVSVTYFQSRFMIIPVELMYFVMLSNAFRKRTCKHESKRKSYESSERRLNNPSLRKTYKPTECQK